MTADTSFVGRTKQKNNALTMEAALSVIRNYNTRVVLHDASIADYLKLYNEMARRNFTDEIVSYDGSVAKLPPGEYVSRGYVTLHQVQELAAAAAASTGRRFAVRVSEVLGTTWTGLDPVRAKAA